MRVLTNWIINKFKKQHCSGALFTLADKEETQLALKHYRLQQLKELDKRFGTEELPQAELQPLAKSCDSAKHHWFEFSCGRRAPKEHQGKQVQIASDTWNRLSASLKRIEERIQAQRNESTKV
jgi:hypothetical protein